MLDSDMTFQQYMDEEMLPLFNGFEPLAYPMITRGNEGLGDILDSLGEGIKSRFLDIKHIFKGIRKSNILFHKSDYGQYRKKHPAMYSKIMKQDYAVLKDIRPIYKPADMAVKYKDTAKVVSGLVDTYGMPYTGYYLLDQSKNLLKLVKRGTTDSGAYIATRENIEKLSKYKSVAEQYSLVLAHYNSDHRNKTVLEFKFSDIFNSAEDFRETDEYVSDRHTLLFNANKIEDVVLATEKVFDDIIYHVQKKSYLDKGCVTAIAGIADVVSVIFGTYGYSISRWNELIHNHVNNLTSIGNKL